MGRLSRFSESLRDKPLEHLGFVALFGLEDPVKDQWLEGMLLKLSDKERDAFAARVGRLLDDTDPEAAAKIWDRWLKNYWEMRLVGKPKPLSRKEAVEMVDWALSLGARMPDAVQLIIHRMSDLVQFEETSLLYRMHSKQIVKSQPQASAEILLFFLEHSSRPILSNYVPELWKDLKTMGVPEAQLKRIRNALLALGCDPEDEAG